MSHQSIGLLDTAPCGFVSFGDDSRILYINTTLVDRLGYSRPELESQAVEKIFTVAGRIFHQTHFFPLVKLHGKAQEIFILLQTKAGEDVGMLCNAVRRIENGAGVTDCVLMEVQERRKFEDALVQARQAADNANNALKIRTKEAEHSSKLLEDQALELELQHQTLQEQAAELEAQSDELMSVNESLQRLNDDLQKQRAIAEEANHAKSNFLAVMSHELRTPLNAIGGYVQLLEMGVHGPIAPAQREALARIDRSQRHLLRLINEVLNLARIESGHVVYRVDRISIEEIVGNVTPMVEPQMEGKNLRLEVSVERPLFACADRDKVEQILLNLLTNAVKFTSQGGTVKVEAGPALPSSVSLRVTDTGVGIPAEMLEMIFEPFVQVDASRSRAAEGTGLGLAISRDLARGMGGDLVAESHLGTGSTFELTLPTDTKLESH